MKRGRIPCHRRRAARAGAALVAASAIVAPLPLAAQTASGADLEIAEITFRGNEAFPDDSLRRAIESRESDCRTLIFEPFCWVGLGFAYNREVFRRRVLATDRQRLIVYHVVRGYREATVDTSVVRDSLAGEVRITFDIEEGPATRVGSIRFTGDSLPGRSYLRRLPLSEGDPLSALLLEATKDSIESRLRNDGYPRADVLRSLFIPADSLLAEVEFNVFTGPRARFGEIDVRWTAEDPALSAESVRRLLPFQSGDLYSREQILEAQRSLFGVDLIQSARIEEDSITPSPDSVVPVRITVNEGDVHRLGAGSGWSSADCFNAESRWTNRNFLGGTRRLTLRGRVSNLFASRLHDSACPQAGEGEFARINWLLSAQLFQPWVFSTRNSLSLSVFAERASLPDVFVRKAVGVNLGLTRNVGRRSPLTLSFRPELSSLEAAEIFFCTSFLVCDPSDIDVLSGSNWLSPVGVSFSTDRTDNLLNPSDGFQLLIDYEHASDITGSDFAYDRVIAEVDGYESFAVRTVFAARLRGGWIGGGEFQGSELDRAVDVVHPQKRFYAGGASSVRGFAQNRLGPRVLTTDVRNLLGFRGIGGGDPSRICTPQQVLDLTCRPEGLDDGFFLPRPTGGTRLLEGNVEYRFAFGGSFQGVFFVDAGQVWREDESIDLGDVEVSPGVGVRYFSPIGPIRVDLGYRSRGGESLGVVTSRIRPFGSRAGDRPGDRICVTAPADFDFQGADTCGSTGDSSFPIEWIRQDDLAVLRDPVLFGESGGFFRHLQLHFSIGQAF